MRTYCPISFALKLALFCLILGLVAGVWLGTVALSTPDSQPARPPSTRATVESLGQLGGEEP